MSGILRRAKRQILSANYVPPLGHIFCRWLRWRLARWALGLSVEAAQNRRFYRPGSFPIRIADGRAGGAGASRQRPVTVQARLVEADQKS